MEDSRNILFYLPYSPYISTYIYEIVIMLPLKYVRHIYLWVSFHQVTILIMSNITILLSKLPLRKCPLHSKFSGSLQSSHLISWNCSPTQYFDHFKITWSNQVWEFLPWGTIVHIFWNILSLCQLQLPLQIPNLNVMQF